MTSDYRSGANAGALTPIDSIVHDPQPAPAFYAEYVPVGNGLTRGAGWLESEWSWKFISLDEIASLHTEFPGVSGQKAITTPDIDGVFTDYTCTYIWPQIPEADRGDYFKDFAIRFIKLIPIPGTNTGTGTGTGGLM